MKTIKGKITANYKSKHILFSSCCIIVLFAAACKTEPKPVFEAYVLENIKGASGLSVFNEKFYIISDNSPYLYILDEDYNTIQNIAVYDTSNFFDGEIAKEIKPDFEAMEIIDNKLLIFGSGSLSPQRDIFIEFDLEKNSFETYSLVEFYDSIKLLDEMLDVELNIEGAAFYKDELYLFNRMNNLIMIMQYEAFLHFVKTGNKFPKIKTIIVDLPEIAGIESGFSGATICNKSDMLYFTSSVENTTDSYNDGEILGSFLGLVHISKISNIDAYSFYEIDCCDEPVKVESVSIEKIGADGNVQLVFVSDSDGGESLLIEYCLIIE